MGLASLRAKLAQHQRIALDTCVFIYELDVNPRYAELARAVFQWIPQPGRVAVASTIALTEILTGPYRSEDEARAAAIHGLLMSYPHLEWIATDDKVANYAAQLRVRYGFRTVGALHAATAIHSHATCLLSNDTAFRRLTEIDTLLLDDYA